MENRKEKGVFKKNFTFVSRREQIVTINRELKISYKVTNKTKIQTFLNIRKKKRKTNYTVKDLTFLSIETENIRYSNTAQTKYV